MGAIEFKAKTTKSVLRLAALCLVLSGCTVPRAEISPEGQLEVFGPSNSFPVSGIPEDWVLEGISVPQLSKVMSIETVDTSPAISLTASENRFVLIRRTNASLLASPFLGWSWSSPGGQQRRPVRLLVGFHGGDPKSRSWGGEPLVYLGTNIPPHDRAIAVVWGGDSDVRGTFDQNLKTPHYIMRTASPKDGQWSNENIDIGRLYRQAWPGDDHVRVKIMFVGFAAAAGRPSLIKFSDLVLYR